MNAVTSLPPLITHHEVDKLCAQLGEVAQGKRFLLQGGDCAERFLGAFFLLGITIIIYLAPYLSSTQTS
jgi:hypothetical protein